MRQSVGINRDTVISRRQICKGVIAVVIGLCLRKQTAITVKQPQQYIGQTFARRWQAVIVLILPYHISQRDRVLCVCACIHISQRVSRVQVNDISSSCLCIRVTVFGVILCLVLGTELIARGQFKFRNIIAMDQTFKPVKAIGICPGDSEKSFPCLVKEIHQDIEETGLSVILNSILILVIPYNISQTGEFNIRNIHASVQGGIVLAG